VLIETAGHALAFHDPRRFGALALAPTAAVEAHPWLARLGPEPLGPAFDTAHLARIAHGRAAPIKALLLDQRAVAGIGNIYACESLFLAGIAPTRPAGRIAEARLDRLAAAIRQTLEAAIRAGGSTLRDHAAPSGELGYFQHAFQVYGREGAPCPACGAPIRRRVQSGRSTFHCPRCQR
jgi:formamidopyrimidine-DNA glycosylase